MIDREVRVHPESDRLPRADQLAWKIAAVAADPVEVEAEVAEMIVNRMIDNAAVAVEIGDGDVPDQSPTWSGFCPIARVSAAGCMTASPRPKLLKSLSLAVAGDRKAGRSLSSVLAWFT